MSAEKFLAWYRSFFSVDEIEQSTTLQWIFAIILVGLFFVLNALILDPAITRAAVINNTFTCWPWFSQCATLHVLTGLPYGYTQGIVGALFFAALAAASFFVWKREWLHGHVLLLLSFFGFSFFMYLVEMRAGLAFGDQLMILTALFLFFKNKLLLLRFGVAILYFFSGLAKVHQGWILGTYFTSIETAMPLFPSLLAPLFSHLVIAMQILGVWFLFSPDKRLRLLTIGFFVLFHMYGLIFTGLTYALVVIPLLVLLFLEYNPAEHAAYRASPAAICFFALLTIAQLIPLAIAGDAKLTGEGALYAFHGFDANHQCRSLTTRHFPDGTNAARLSESPFSSKRCDPYDLLFAIQNECRALGKKVARISWTLDSSINGSPLYRIVDVEDACTLRYSTLRHNPWIRLDPPAVGMPVQNLYLP